MDFSSLPNIIALALLLTNYRPLLRRAGGHTSLWFYGWGFILLNSINRFFAGPASLGSSGIRLAIATSTLECGGLMFLLGSANRQRTLIDHWTAVLLATGPLSQALLFAFGPEWMQRLLPFSIALYFLPAAYVALRRIRSSRPTAITAAMYALFGLASASIVAHPLAVRASAILLIFLCAAYLSLETRARLDRANVTTTVGLLLWGLKYPGLLLLQNGHLFSAVNRGLLQVPEYFVLAGSVLSIIQERLTRAERLATHDPLTNLPNRRFLEERFREALEEAREARTTVACLVIDVDDFKTINDTRGHRAGDAILCALAVRLAWHLSPRDVLARTGGDEFTAMLAGVSNEHYLRFIAEAMMSAASVPVQVDGEPVEVSISMGISLSPDDADEIDDLVRLADEAMYRAKRRGGNVPSFAGDTAQEPETVHSRRRESGQLLQMSRSRSAASRRTALTMNATDV